MCEVTVIMLVLLAAIEINCKDLFDATDNHKIHTAKLQPRSGPVYSWDRGSDLDCDKGLPVFRSRKHCGKKEQENAATRDVDML